MYRKYLLPKVFANYFDLNRSIYSYNTRGSNNLHIMSVHNDGKRIVKYKASSIWNQLPSSIKSKPSKMKFLHKIKFFLQIVETSLQNNAVLYIFITTMVLITINVC